MRTEEVQRKYGTKELFELMRRVGNEPLDEMINALWDDRNEVIREYLEVKKKYNELLHKRAYNKASKDDDD